MLDAQNFIARFCASCGSSTRWDPVLDSDKVRGATPPSGELGPHVLLIDDDEAILKIIGKALSAADCDVETADSARDAAMLLARGDYDAIVSDIRMPGFDGTQLFEFLEKHLPEYKARVIFLTGDTGNPATMEFLEKSGAPFLTKPIDINDLLARLKRSTTKSA